MSKWVPILEMDLDSGEHTCYSRAYGDNQYIWVTQMADGSWNVEVSSSDTTADYQTIAKSVSLHGAKSRALRYIRQIIN